MARALATDRRGFLLAAGGVAGWLAASRAASAQEAGGADEGGAAAAPPASASPEITEATIAEAEKLVGLSFTDAERRQMLETAKEFAGLAARLRLPHPDEEGVGFRDDGPAEVFSPLLPGDEVDRGGVRFVPRPHRPRPLPDDPADIAFASLADLSHWLQTRALRSEDLTRLYLERLRRLGPRLECVVTLLEDEALEQARRADAELDRGEVRSPLHGIPWGAKDLFDTAGVRTTWGAKPYERRVPKRDATVVRRLADAGAVLVAKLSMGALAYGDIWFGGKTRNPFDLEQGSSGSSAGSAAAVVAGLVGFTLGTETYGSIGSPSARCGASGFRPTFGRVSRAGAMTLCWSLDKVGPICRSADDCARVLAAIAGPDPLDPATRDAALTVDLSRPLEGVRVGVAGERPEGDAVLSALEAEGCRIVEDVALPEGRFGGLIFLHICVEAAAAFDELTRSGRDDELVWQDEEAWPNTFRATRFFPAVPYFQARRRRRMLMRAMRDAWEGFDLLYDPRPRSRLVAVTNMTGHPESTFRVGFDEKGRPRAAHLWARPFDDGLLLRATAAVEERLGLVGRRPPLG